MSKKTKKLKIIAAITFAELVKHGLENGANIVNGMPWSWAYKGHSITHENDSCYLIDTGIEIVQMTKTDMLVTSSNGNLYVYDIEKFEKQYVLNSIQ